jgi:MoxR-like ATPase
MARQAPNHTLSTNTFCGVRRLMSPLTPREMEQAGFTPAERPNNYVEDSGIGWMQDASMFLKVNHLIVQGPAGTGKDDLVKAFCHAFNIPCKRFAFKQGTSPTDWVTRTTLVSVDGGTETKEVEGELLKACRGVPCKRDFTGATEQQISEAIKDMESNGYTVINNGGILTITVPAVVIFSDADRATPDMLELLREAVELGKEMIANPIEGGLFKVLPNTRFYFTANSGADGGSNGNITQMKDSSFLSRLIGIYAPPPTPKFERMVVQAEFPMFNTDQVKLLVDCNRAIRKVAEEQDMGLEITLRQAKQWGHACLVVMDDLGITDFKKALKRSFVILKGHLNIKHNQDTFEGAIDPYLRSDVVDEQSSQSSQCPIDM